MKEMVNRFSDHLEDFLSGARLPPTYGPKSMVLMVCLYKSVEMFAAHVSFFNPKHEDCEPFNVI